MGMPIVEVMIAVARLLIRRLREEWVGTVRGELGVGLGADGRVVVCSDASGVEALAKFRRLSSSTSREWWSVLFWATPLSHDVVELSS